MRSGCLRWRTRRRFCRTCIAAGVGPGGPGDDLEMAVVAFADSGAAFHPVAAVDVTQAVVVVHGGGMDMTADHAVRLMVPCFRRQRLLERADIVDRVLDLQLRPLGE